MKDSDKRQFWELLKATYEIYGKYPTPTAAKMWWGSLKFFTFESVQTAFSHHINSNKYLPRPSEIREILRLAEDSVKARQRTPQIEHRMTSEQRKAGLEKFKQMTKEVFKEFK